MNRVRALTASIIVFILLVAGGATLVVQRERLRASAERHAAAHAAAGAAFALERQLAQSLSAAYALATFVRQLGGVHDFDALAAEMLPIYGGISSLQLAPGGVVRHVYPRDGNAAVLGHDLLRDPQRRFQAHEAVRTRRLTLAGPFELLQGGMGVVGRLPIFVSGPEPQDGERFWGFATVVVRLRDLVESADVARLSEDYVFAIAHVDADTGERVLFYRGTGALPDDPVCVPVKVPDGEWQLEVGPAGGWKRDPLLPLEALAVLVIAAGLALLAHSVLRRPEVLRREVAARTAELARANAQLAADGEARRQAESALLQAQKLEAIGQLAGGVAHDFNNLLTGILAHAEILAEAAPPGSDTHESAAIIGDAAARAAELTKQLLGFARRGKLVVAPVDTHAALHEAARLLRRTLDKRIRVVERLGAASSVVFGDAGQLQQALLNLAVNARDAMPEGGELVFSTAVVDVDADFCARHPGATPGPHVAIAVEDTGHGIPPELQSRVFEPFFTTKDPGRGTGMGLAMVYGIARNHGGVVSLDSEPGRGARFTLWLPLAAQQAAPAPPAPRAGCGRASGRVLVVDDDEVPRAAAARILRGLGYDVVAAASGAEAVRWFSEHHARCDAVLLDLSMPGMDGGACFRALRAIDPGVRVVLTSGYGRDGRAQELLDAGVVAFAPKPFQAGDLAEALALATSRAA
jgi:signal transduction histidine kinase